MQTPPPQYSPDGQFWWDGYRWIPVGTPTAPVPADKGREALHGCLMALICVGWVCFAAVCTQLLVVKPPQPDSADAFAAVFGLASGAATLWLIRARRQ